MPRLDEDACDLVIRNGLVVDGSGAEPRIADVAIRDGMIAQVGSVTRQGREELDARDRIVTPGVRGHSHPLRWSRHLGRPAQSVFLPRRYDSGDGQLRGRLRAMQAP